MDRKITTNDFLNAISQYDNSYQKFSNNHVPVYKEFYVESSDDAIFYSNYFYKLYNYSILSKFHGCNGKKEVLREYKKYTGKKAGFIVDLDYLPINKTEYEKVILTTGYSMENFIFFNNGQRFNFESIFQYYYPNSNVCRKMVEKYLVELREFKEKNLLYFAYFKTCMEFSYGNNFINSHLKIKNFINSDVNIAELIDNEIKSLNSFIKPKFNKKYQENIQQLNDSQFMLIRGHDILDHLIDFIKKDGKHVKIYDVMKMASTMEIPESFLLQISTIN